MDKFNDMDAIRNAVAQAESQITLLQNRSANFHEEVGCTCEDEHSLECDTAQAALLKMCDEQEARFQQQIDDLDAIVKLADEYGDWAVDAALDDEGGNVSDACDLFKYGGPYTYEDEEDYARQYLDGTGEMSEFLASYIDYERLGNDLLQDEVRTSEFGGMIYVWQA